MILADLENGIDRPGIKEKYNLEGWEMTEMFKHPVLKGKKASRKRKMSFNFVDDTVAPTATVVPVQVDLVESIEDVQNMTDNHLAQEADDREQFEASMEEEQKADGFGDGFDEE